MAQRSFSDLSIDIVNDVCCGLPKRQAITAAHNGSERCSLGAESRLALQNFACTTRGEERGHRQPSPSDQTVPRPPGLGWQISAPDYRLKSIFNSANTRLLQLKFIIHKQTDGHWTATFHKYHKKIKKTRVKSNWLGTNCKFSFRFLSPIFIANPTALRSYAFI